MLQSNSGTCSGRWPGNCIAIPLSSLLVTVTMVMWRLMATIRLYRSNKERRCTRIRIRSACRPGRVGAFGRSVGRAVACTTVAASSVRLFAALANLYKRIRKLFSDHSRCVTVEVAFCWLCNCCKTIHHQTAGFFNVFFAGISKNVDRCWFSLLECLGLNKCFQCERERQISNCTSGLL